MEDKKIEYIAKHSCRHTGIKAEVGDTIAYNPPHYKGLDVRKVREITKAGAIKTDDGTSLRTGYVIVEFKNGKRLRK